jgi:hypothetical protein
LEEPAQMARTTARTIESLRAIGYSFLVPMPVRLRKLPRT